MSINRYPGNNLDNRYGDVIRYDLREGRDISARKVS
jgi:hypothetical protein